MKIILTVFKKNINRVIQYINKFNNYLLFIDYLNIDSNYCGRGPFVINSCNWLRNVKNYGKPKLFDCFGGDSH